MNCHATRAVLDLHAEGRLTPRREKAVAAHLATCAVCSAQAATEPYGEGVSLPRAVGKGPPDFKSRLAAAMKAERKAPKNEAPRPTLNLWPRDFSGVAFAAAALALVALVIGWSGVPSQQFDKGDELAAGRTP
jgi:anti-sigma factor RsiW